jgi:hypothetical protein
MKRISLSERDAGHIYELASQNFQDGCYQCELIKTRLEKFIGPDEVKFIKKIVKKNPY